MFYKDLASELGIPAGTFSNQEEVEDVLFHAFKETLNPLPILFVEDIHCYIPDRTNINDDYELPKEIRRFLNFCVTYVSQNKLKVILTVSELDKVECFTTISGSSRLRIELFRGHSRENLITMLSKIDVMVSNFKKPEEAANKIVDVFGSFMIGIQEVLSGLSTMKSCSMEELEELFSIPDHFSPLMKKGIKPEVCDLSVACLFAELILRCMSHEKVETILIDGKFFKRFGDHKCNISYFHFKQYYPYLLQHNILLLIDLRVPKYAVNNKPNIQAWRTWVADQSNISSLEEMRILVSRSRGLEFPSMEMVDKFYNHRASLTIPRQRRMTK
jgi:hypothetical protein